MAIARWTGVTAAARGRGHERSGAPCQDVAEFTTGPTTVFVLADGMGSAAHAEAGAQAVVAAARDFFRICSRPLSDGPEAFRNDLFAALRARLERTAAELGVPERDLSSTLLVVAVDAAAYLACHVGDGVIGVRRDGYAQVLSTPTNGEFANQTVAVGHLQGPDGLRLVGGPLTGVDAFLLMSDGAAASLHGRPSPEVPDGALAPAVAHWWNGLGTHAPSQVGVAVREAVNGPIRRQTRDDCSVVVAARVGIDLRKQVRGAQLLGFVAPSRGLRSRRRVASAWSRHGAEASTLRIARAVGLHPSTVRRHRNTLRALGWAVRGT